MGSKANQTYKVQFFSNPPNTYEGQTFIGEKIVTTGVDGTAYLTLKPKTKVKPGQSKTATATHAEGNTSEFSDSKTVTTK